MRQNKQNSITTVIGKKGSGKSTLAEIISVCDDKPKIIIDPRMQFHSDVKRRVIFRNVEKLKLTLLDIDKFKEFYNRRLEIVLHTDDETEVEKLFEFVYRYMQKITLVIDEVDMFCNAYTQNSSYIYKLINFARHKEINIITTSRRPANISRSLTANTDTFYFARISEPNDLDYANKILNKEVIEAIGNLEKFEFIKYTEETNESVKLKTTLNNIEIIDSL
ncbi:MAG: ATP-binding protein [Campylobacteraceae bacterium]|jgi:ABC-type dipeptide/oligopeptide/nickel transport system ATPase component|nr:ATP-binding protein [Campylobacteraceae bacterium]